MSPARWPVTAVAVAVAMSVLTPASPVAAQSRLLSFLGGARTTQPPAVRDAPRAERQWPFGRPAKTPTMTQPWAGPGADKTTEDRRRVSQPTAASPVRYTATTTTTMTQRPTTTTTTATTARQTTTTTTRYTETTTRKLETTTSDRHIISAPLHPCPDGQRMSPDRKCVDNYTDPEDGR